MRSWCSVSSLCDTCPGDSLSPSPLSPSLFYVFALPMQMQQCVEKCLRFDLATFLYGQFVTASLPLSLPLPPSLSPFRCPSLLLSVSLFLSLSLRLFLSLKHFSGIPSSRCSLLLHLNCATCYLSFSMSPSLCFTHTHSLAVQLLLLEFNSECSTRSALAQCAERKTLDTNLDSRARRSRSDACKLLQARAVTSLSPTTTRPLTYPPHPYPPARAHYVTSGDSASKHANYTENSICE